MAFIQGTKILTNSGWKNIEDISGHDKVLVRNFIGDAEFLQPFALKKRQYSGDIFKIGANNWSFSVTPKHLVSYDRDDMPIGAHINSVAASKIEAHPKNRVYRKFKYLAAEEYKRERVTIFDEFGKHEKHLSNEDWFVLVGFILCKGKLDNRGTNKDVLSIYLNEEKKDEEIKILTDILDRIGVRWSLLHSDRWFIRISVKNTLASRVAYRLGSRTRKKMFLPDKMIYDGSKELAGMLIETIIALSIKKDTKRGDVYQFVSSNKKLINSLVLLGTVWGYGMSSKLLFKKGTDTGYAVLKNNVYSLAITRLTETYAIVYNKKSTYSGSVYEIDLFDGQVYVRGGSMPVWVNPK